MSIQEEIRAWHEEHFGHLFPEAALRKAVVEFGELVQADFDLNEDDPRDDEWVQIPREVLRERVSAEIGDVLICLYAYSARNGIDPVEALRGRWPEVRDRTEVRIRRSGRAA